MVIRVSDQGMLAALPGWRSERGREKDDDYGNWDVCTKSIGLGKSSVVLD